MQGDLQGAQMELGGALALEELERQLRYAKEFAERMAVMEAEKTDRKTRRKIA